MLKRSLSAYLVLVAMCLSLLQTVSCHRKLLQTTDFDCTTVHTQCLSCVPKTSVNGTNLTCTSCNGPRYQVYSDTCGCSPGYQASAKGCEPCGKGAFCPGGLGSAAVSQSCGQLLTTDDTTAEDASACITLPGVAFMSGVGTAAMCPAGYYNVGGNQRNCTRCPHGLVTAASGATGAEACSAPAGYFYQNRQALPCAVGTYKNGINKDRACQVCPEGTTTGTYAATSALHCNVTLPGYQPLLHNRTGDIVGAEPCPIGTFSPQGAECIMCPHGLTTQAPNQADSDACLAPPGFGYYPEQSDTSGVATDAILQTFNASVLPCPPGSYKAGWNLNPCVSCGIGFLTDPAPATMADHCYLPPGYGSKRQMSDGSVDAAALKDLAAIRCLNGTYGLSDRRYGVEAMPCQPCPENMATPDQNPDNIMTGITDNVLMTSIGNCSNKPGYGWQQGLAVQCPLAYYSPGFDLRPCVHCGEGLTTVGSATTRPQDCIAAPGWQLVGLAAAEVCPTGSWSSGGSAPCQACPEGSTTADTGATALTDCRVCAPGWGGVENPDVVSELVMCAPCTYGFYSPGRTSNPCIPCGAGLTSPVRASDSSACYPQWSISDPHNWIPTPLFAMTPASSVVASAGNRLNATTGALHLIKTRVNITSASASTAVALPADSVSCQSLCATSSSCQYYVLKTNQHDPTQNGCWLKLQTSTPAPNTYLSLKLGTGDYTIWQADAGFDAQIGNGVDWPTSEPKFKPINPNSCLDACDASAACLGTWVTYASSTASWQCKLLSGEFRNDVMSSIQAVPQRINDNRWTEDCIGVWGAFGPCSVLCGHGVQHATYKVIQPARGDGAWCEFADGATKNQSCNTHPCPQACSGSWTWSECSAQCGRGTQQGTFRITTPAAVGGAECEAADGDSTIRTCYIKACSKPSSPPPQKALAGPAVQQAITPEHDVVNSSVSDPAKLAAPRDSSPPDPTNMPVGSTATIAPATSAVTTPPFFQTVQHINITAMQGSPLSTNKPA